jgi:hypothetical protein
MKTRGRPRTSPLPRREQLRLAKRAQRHRERQADVAEVQLKLPKQVAEKLTVARSSSDFVDRLEAALDRVLVRVADYPELRDIAWNRRDALIPASEAFQLYERNWRFVDRARLSEAERQLIERLKNEYGNGELNA